MLQFQRGHTAKAVFCPGWMARESSTVALSTRPKRALVTRSLQSTNASLDVPPSQKRLDPFPEPTYIIGVCIQNRETSQAFRPEGRPAYPIEPRGSVDPL